jgi:farnesyl-diphosphate farnesyltransferase
MSSLQMESELLGGLLREVSRSFYLTLRVLPRGVRKQIGLAYLLARTSDTVADTEIVRVEQRLAMLERLRNRIMGAATEPLAFEDIARNQGARPEQILLEKVEQSIAVLNAFAEADRRLIRQVLDTITSGQELDLTRFGNAAKANIVALESEAALDDYTYRVAGCVGEFWTRMCRAHLFPHARLDDGWLTENGIRFGKGLQLVNILRDLPKDLAQGRCYLPNEQLAAVGLRPEQLLSPVVEPALRPVYNHWLECAEGHLKAGWAYTNALPRGQVRVRLACAWPVLIGLETVALLKKENVLDPEQRIKISRRAVRRIIGNTVLWYPFKARWEKLADPASHAEVQRSGRT